MRKFKTIAIKFIFVLLASTSLHAQMDEIKLNNSSFEDYPRASRPPIHWNDCGFPDETPPDVQPFGGFNVSHPAFDGNTYLGMVTRDNDTWESVSQQLDRPFKAGKCYSFSIYLCRSDMYQSPSRTTQQVEDFTAPIKLRIWGGYSNCDKAQLLAESPLVSNTTWQKNEFTFKPNAGYTYIVLEAFFKTPTLFPYNGNLLIDKASTIQQIPCPGEVVAENPKDPSKVNISPKKPKDNTPNNPVENPKVDPKTPESVKATPEAFSPSLKSDDIKAGQTFRIENLYFKADSATLSRVSYKTLDEVYIFLKDHSNIFVEIGGHTNSLPPDDFCDKLSTSRAKAVADYLIFKGIAPERVKYIGYGKRQPIATNDNLEGRRKNQRVELKILKVE